MTSSPDSPPERPERSEQYVKNPYAVSPHVGALSGEGSAADHIELPHTSRMAIVAMTLASCSVFGLLFIPLGLLGTVGMVLGGASMSIRSWSATAWPWPQSSPVAR